ncbi:MAG: hypothetical protein JXN65_03870 [Clostridia bacterium]|nr:hypothetical protein [Clostridia bacterium]
MKLSIYNGSPRGSSSNSDVFSDLLAEGMGNSIEISKYYLKDTAKHQQIINDVSDCYFVVFPLYADLAPYAVKVFFEKMEENKEIYSGKPIYFFIHSGFPEAKQSRLLERYLKYFCKIIGAECKSVCIMGNSEGVRHLNRTSKRYNRIKFYMHSFAQDIINDRQFNEEGIRFFHMMETLPKPVLFIFRHFPSIFNKGFDIMIKKKGAYEKRFDKPYA